MLKMRISHFRFFLLLAIGFFVLFFSVPGNHTEAEDAFHYAGLIEKELSAESFHPHHLLYIPLQKTIYRVVKFVGFSGRSYGVALTFSLVSGVFTLPLFFMVTSRFLILCGESNRENIAFWSSLGFLFSYGFWRYSCEVEIYVPAVMMTLLSLWFSFSPSARLRFYGGILSSCSAILLHILTAVPCLVIIPLILFLNGRSRREVFCYTLCAIILVAFAYIITGFVWGMLLPYSEVPAERFVGLGAVLKGGIGFGQALLSGNFLFAYELFGVFLQDVFPYRMLGEEIYMGQACPGWIRVVGSITFPLALISLCGMFCCLRFPRRKSVFLVFPLWLLGASLPTLLLEPSNPELWIFALVPFWISICVMYAQRWESVLSRRVCISGIVLLGLHNAFGGMGVIRNKAGDYNYQKSKWILEHTGADDVVICADTFVFVSYLRYWSDASVVDANQEGLDQGSGGTYVLGDIFDYSVSLSERYPHQAARVSLMANRLRPLCYKIYDDEFGGCWKLVNDEI